MSENWAAVGGDTTKAKGLALPQDLSVRTLICLAVAVLHRYQTFTKLIFPYTTPIERELQVSL